MHRFAILALTAALAGCAAAPSQAAVPASPEPTPVPQVTLAPTPVPTPVPQVTLAPTLIPLPTPTPTADPDAALVTAARTYATAAGFRLDSAGTPSVTSTTPSYDDMVLRLVSLPLADAEGAALNIYFDPAGAILVVEDHSPTARSSGSDASRAQALVAAAAHFRLAGINPSGGVLNVADGAVGKYWYITLDRKINGYAVANRPMWWGIIGDHAYVSMRGDTTLVDLYAIRPPSVDAANPQSASALAPQLAAVAGLSMKKLAALHPLFTWVRQQSSQGVSNDLTLNYCVTMTEPYRWQGWCVDAGTGERSLRVGGVD
jgi:hypothetical protein